MALKNSVLKLDEIGNFSVAGNKKKAYTVNPLLLRRTVDTDINYKRFENLADMFKIFRKKITE